MWAHVVVVLGRGVSYVCLALEIVPKAFKEKTRQHYVGFIGSGMTTTRALLYVPGR